MDAQQLADDLRRQLEGLTVRARKDTIRYRTRKFIRRNRYAEAETLLRRALALREAAGGNGSELASTLDRLAEVLDDKGELSEAEAVTRRALEISRRRPGDHLDTARYLGRLGAILRRRGEQLFG